MKVIGARSIPEHSACRICCAGCDGACGVAVDLIEVPAGELRGDRRTMVNVKELLESKVVAESVSGSKPTSVVIKLSFSSMTEPRYSSCDFGGWWTIYRIRLS